MKNKKSIAMAMAAVSTLGAVAPAFAAETTIKLINASKDKSVDIALTQGNKILNNQKYGEVYDTHFTDDKKDDTVKKGITILDVIPATETSEAEYLVSTKMTIKDLTEADKKDETDKAKLEKILASKIENEKHTLEALKKEIEYKLALTFIDAKGEKKSTYTIDKANSGEIQAEDIKDGKLPGNVYQLVLKNNDTNSKEEKEIVYHFKNIKVEEKATEDKVEVKEESINLLDAAYNEYDAYKKLSKYAFELSMAKNITVETKEVNPTTLEINVFKKDEKKTKVAKITINDMNLFEADKFTKIATNGDFVGHWAQDQIVDAMIAGQVDVADNYRPQDSITRAEFAKIACTVFGIEVSEGKDEPFHDVNNSDWHHKYVAALYNTKVGGQSVVQGDGENFRPNDKITRQEVAVIVSKLVSGKAKETKIDVNGTKVDKVVKTNFKDDEAIAAWADQSVKYLNETAKYTNAKGEQKAIVEGHNGLFNPTQAITRAEALVMVQRAGSATTK